MSDSELQIIALTNAVSCGDQAALGQLFDEYRGKLRKMISFRMAPQLQGRIDPSDVLQEAFLDLAKRMPEFKHKGDLPILVWFRMVTTERLLAIHRTHICAQKRDARRDVSLHQYSDDSDTHLRLADALIDQLSSIDQRAIRAEERDTLHRMISEMDPVDREVIVMRIFEELTNGETAAILEITKQAASRRFIGAVQRLRNQIQSFSGFTSLE